MINTSVNGAPWYAYLEHVLSTPLAQAFIVAVIAIVLFFILDYVFDKAIRAVVRISRKGDVENAKFIFRIILIVAILAAIAYVYGQYLLVAALLVIFGVIIIVGARPIIEEYFTGKLIKLVREYSFNVGDHVEVAGIKGYVLRETPLGIVVRSSRNEIVYVPYTLVMKGIVRVASLSEGVEIRIPFKVPRNEVSINELRDELTKYMEDLGVEEPRVDIASIEERYIELIARGSYKDLRTMDDVRYSILNKVYELTSEAHRRSGGVRSNE
ncbi:mechanosensitive ion channel domain-containing protein [Vulcanisaeta thermophila]|uniref:mechanosensitive ion channel domain-containing protein n=1 Tax=Vulcanisaeta thermophila TaxID=867917 RepID=UPI0011804F93|nr:mechanosensitive ion channel domain-containing protein [Vulcanisaeta thermophila]